MFKTWYFCFLICGGNNRASLLSLSVFWCFILGNELQVKRNIDLVYGGGSVGLMGLISQRMYDGGCHVLGYAKATYFVL